jgi:hypothetical protein
MISLSMKPIASKVREKLTHSRQTFSPSVAETPRESVVEGGVRME